MAEYIEREAVIDALPVVTKDRKISLIGAVADFIDIVFGVPAADVVPVVHDYREGDVCIYGFAEENKCCAIVEIVKVLDDDRGVAKVKFLKVICDDTGNGLFNYLQKCGDTMNASFKYMKNITPRIEGERK
jgi:hypothetical protein